MSNIIREYVFRPVEGIWRDTAGNGEILADVLNQYGVIVDDKCQFARLYNYHDSWCMWYRAYGSMKITITLYKIR